jgi:hypothetical protein
LTGSSTRNPEEGSFRAEVDDSDIPDDGSEILADRALWKQDVALPNGVGKSESTESRSAKPPIQSLGAYESLSQPTGQPNR